MKKINLVYEKQTFNTSSFIDWNLVEFWNQAVFQKCLENFLSFSRTLETDDVFRVIWIYLISCQARTIIWKVVLLNETTRRIKSETVQITKDV